MTLPDPITLREAVARLTTAITERDRLAAQIDEYAARERFSALLPAQQFDARDRVLDRLGIQWADLRTVLARVEQVEKLLTEDDIREDLQKWADVAGSIAGVARDLDINGEQLRLFMVKKRPLEPALAKALQLESVTYFRRAAQALASLRTNTDAE